jgi:hypothetical protein
MAREEGFGIAGGFAVLVKDLKRENGSPIYHLHHSLPILPVGNEWHE